MILFCSRSLIHTCVTNYYRWTKVFYEIQKRATGLSNGTFLFIGRGSTVTRPSGTYVWDRNSDRYTKQSVDGRMRQLMQIVEPKVVNVVRDAVREHQSDPDNFFDQFVERMRPKDVDDLSDAHQGKGLKRKVLCHGMEWAEEDLKEACFRKTRQKDKLRNSFDEYDKEMEAWYQTPAGAAALQCEEQVHIAEQEARKAAVESWDNSSFVFTEQSKEEIREHHRNTSMLERM